MANLVQYGSRLELLRMPRKMEVHEKRTRSHLFSICLVWFWKTVESKSGKAACVLRGRTQDKLATIIGDSFYKTSRFYQVSTILLECLAVMS